MTTSNWVTARLWSISCVDRRSFWASVLATTFLFSSQLALAQFTQQGPKLVGTGAVGGAAQGNSIALSADGNTAIVGGPSDNYDNMGGGRTGAAWVFTRSGGTWTQQGGKLVGTAAIGGASQGSSVGAALGLRTACHGRTAGISAFRSRSRPAGVRAPRSGA
jgi:hypothetical protein